MFKTDNKKLEDRLGDSYNDALSTYLEACNDVGLTPEQKLKYFHNVFCGEARRCYRDHVEGVANSFQEASSIMKTEYNSNTRHNRCRQEFLELTSAGP